ncbi:hypothetical protein E2C01_045992 [Portunus trituberculatus]|uniref:Uncharacterized protein n=1 Tax=Portunus trituberculatus TaxID=210409 RepID=A0A5B7FX87_PORTR|nr:hypothetical protein [Portunus trituberculatus]
MLWNRDILYARVLLLFRVTLDRKRIGAGCLRTSEGAMTVLGAFIDTIQPQFSRFKEVRFIERVPGFGASVLAPPPRHSTIPTPLQALHHGQTAHLNRPTQRSLPPSPIHSQKQDLYPLLSFKLTRIHSFHSSCRKSSYSPQRTLQNTPTPKKQDLFPPASTYIHLNQLLHALPSVMHKVRTSSASSQHKSTILSPPLTPRGDVRVARAERAVGKVRGGEVVPPTSNKARLGPTQRYPAMPNTASAKTQRKHKALKF